MSTIIDKIKVICYNIQKMLVIFNKFSKICECKAKNMYLKLCEERVHTFFSGRKQCPVLCGFDIDL